ncbi:hypothetical protein LCGC14_0358660 [marine sediment metagenome]|uniref:Uncharacterized protein n=1 Tax=marine sediment metagenome TaxID=412755 RepID=A0A0F9VVW4_9ZZZZ
MKKMLINIITYAVTTLVILFILMVIEAFAQCPHDWVSGISADKLARHEPAKHMIGYFYTCTECGAYARSDGPSSALGSKDDFDMIFGE